MMRCVKYGDRTPLPYQPLALGNDVHLPKGEYLFIDPYLLDLTCVAAYMRVLDKPPHEAVVTQEDGCPMVIAPTCDGDGVFEVCRGERVIGEVGVDSGTLALVPLTLVDRKDRSRGVRVALKRATKIVYEQGNWAFGAYSVFTD